MGNFETNECKDNIVDDDVDDDEDYEDDDDLYDWDGCSGNFTKKYNAVNSHTSQVCTHEQMSRDSVKATSNILADIACLMCWINIYIYIHLLQPNANPPKRQHQKMTAYQPAEKTLSKFVEKINVGEHCFFKYMWNLNVMPSRFFSA